MLKSSCKDMIETRAKYGAKSVAMSDINPKAVENTKKNIERFSLSRASVRRSDLFNAFSSEEKYDLIVFNHPFFPGDPQDFEDDPTGNEMLRRSMLGGTDLIKRFLQEVPNYLVDGGEIVMPYFRFAGKENDPISHVSDDEAFKIVKEEIVHSNEGLQKGEVVIYVIRLA